MNKLEGRTALVTGGARGLGREYALRLAGLGANVGVIDVNLHSYRDYDREVQAMTAESVVEELEALGVKALGVEADVRDWDQVHSAVETLAKALGDITILVANAGGGLPGESQASSMNLEDFRHVVERNLYGTVYAVTAVAPYMKANHFGKIVTVASQAGLQSNRTGGYAHYGAAKAAIIMYTKYLAQDLGPYGVTANCIAPGYIGTGRLMLSFERQGIENVNRNIALGRIGTPEDCARVVEFLTTDLSDYVTGAVLDVSGGSVRGGA